MENYNTARTEGKQNVEKVRQAELEAVDATITTKKGELDEINGLIETKKTEDAKKEIESASKLANADYFINLLPKKYETELTCDGGNLSSGQRQLLSIARSAIANPPVLILDEATSSIDTRTEKLIQDGMDSLMKGRTVFVIAHRLSTVRNADLILVLENGNIIESGNHEQLIAQKGRYYSLYTGLK